MSRAPHPRFRLGGRAENPDLAVVEPEPGRGAVFKSMANSRPAAIPYEIMNVAVRKRWFRNFGLLHGLQQFWIAERACTGLPNDICGRAVMLR